MKSRRRLQAIFVALLFVVMSVGAGFSQEQDDQAQNNGAPPPPPPNATAQQSYPDQGGQQPGYPGQGGQPQGYPDQGSQQQQLNPPGRVARVQYMEGEVSMQPGGVNDWIAASTNRPLTTSDRIWTDKNSKAELNVGDGFLRMNSETSVTLTNVSDGTVQIELDQGTLSVTVRHLENGEIYEVDTPNYAFTVMKPGSYRFDVYPNEDQSWVTVRSGYGEATGKGTAVRVNSGQQLRFKSGNSLIHTAENAPARDGFDDWVQVRDKRLDDSLSARYVSPGVIGYQDLDAYGSWTTTPDYGPVWTPYSVPAGWAPYRYGQWVWIAPWGWTWVDSAPWGFAPFHYGRWVSWGGAWAWSPGPLGYWNPYYAPALVGWIGGPGFGVGFGFGGGWGLGIGIGFGWFPLGWGQPFYPRYCGWGYGGWYRGGGYVTGNYFRNVNITNTRITNITNVTNNYYNNNVNAMRNTNVIARNGVTSASRSAFTSGALVNKVGGAVPSSALNNAHMLNTAGASPTRSSVLGGQLPRTTGVPSASAGRSVVTRATPPARAASFDNAQSAAARGNSNSPGRGESNVGAANNAARNGLGSTNTQAARGAERGVGTTQTEARATAPESSASRGVPRPPSAGGAASTSGVNSGTGMAASSASHNVPRPPAGNDSFARPNNGSEYSSNRGAAPSETQRSGASSAPAYTANRGGNSTPQTGSRGSSAYGSASGRSASVPRPPANYSYHAAPSYSASSSYGSRPSFGASRSSNGYYGGSSRSSSSPNYNSGRSYSSPSYNSGRSAYGSSPSYGSRSYGSTPSYSARSYGSSPSSGRSYGSSPSYGSRSYGSSSAPHYSGGSSYHGSSSGGGSHSSGGGHSGGGGHGR